MAISRGPTRSVSLQQVADAAGVSLACASYALRRSRKIPEATRDRVLAAAERLRYRPNPRFAALLLIGLPSDRPTLARRLRESRADAWIVSEESIFDELNALGLRPPAGATAISLNCAPAKVRFGGIDNRFDLVAANAVDLVISQLNGGETGVPAIPRMLLFPGGWVEPATSRPAPATRARARRRTGSPHGAGREIAGLRGRPGGAILRRAADGSPGSQG